jgi:hypothetical protein
MYAQMNASKVMVKLIYLGVIAKKRQQPPIMKLKARLYRESLDTICLAFCDQVYYSYHPKLEIVGLYN